MPPRRDESSQDPRTPEERSHEYVMGEVSDVLLNLEHASTRAKKALTRVRKESSHPNIEIALTAAAEKIEETRKHLMQNTYYAPPEES